ncbi:MAG: rhomboid family intramembrane serine protease [Anaerolineae bacterium]
MRLIGVVDAEPDAFAFQSFLKKEGIESFYEFFEDTATERIRFRIWVYDEDHFDRALEWFSKYEENPDDPIFQVEPPPSPLEPPPKPSREEPPRADPSWKGSSWKIRLDLRPKTSRHSWMLIHVIVFICTVLLLWNGLQETKMPKATEGGSTFQLGFTSLQKELLFDYPASYTFLEKALAAYPIVSEDEIKKLPPQGQQLYAEYERIPSWKGVYDLVLNWKTTGWSYVKIVPMFEKIKKGEVWRLFTPCLMHYGFLHLLFNMGWAWVLGIPIESRIGKWKMALLVILIAIISNLAQYLMSGFAFLGFSAVDVGLAGFIWMRQKIAPWEGYLLQKATLLFLFVYVAAIFALGVVSFFLQLFKVGEFPVSFANTAHIVGGLAGLLFGRFSFFSRRPS